MNRRLYHFEGSKLSALRIAAACTVCLIQSTIATSDDQTFRTLVAPLFEEKCLSCHNDGDRKGQLSLVDRDSAMNGGESGAAIVPSDKRASRLLDMIRVKAGKARMPKGGQPLRSDEIAAVENWIADGARWPDSLRLSRPEWWSRRPLTRPGVPRVNDPEFEIRTPIDAFILRTLRQHGLQPSVEADRTTLVRRLYFDLLGLPPTPREVSRFVNDSSADAYERLVDRLLASPHYGERWARHWLDVVKYADTCGYDKDKLRPNAWPYRDYVVRSLNSDKPYWQFVHEQIAGDALFPGEPDGILGLGFVAAGPWDFIGHVEVPESKIDGKVARNLDRDDMVSNVLNTFCSVTIQCARCHDHKFDPITQEHYYGLQAVFAAVDRADRPYDEDPDVRARRGDLTAQLDTSQEALARLEEQVKEEGGAQLVALDARIAELQKETRASEVNPAFGYHSSIASSADDRKWVQVELEEPTEFTQIVLRPCQDDFAGIGAGFGFPVRFRVEAANDRQFKQAVVSVADYTTKDFVNPALDPLVIEFETTEARYVRVTATRLAERQNDYIFALAELQVLDGAGTNVAKGGGVESLDSIESMPRWGRANLTDGIWPEAAAPASARQLAASESARRTLLACIEPSDDRLERERLAAMVQELSDELTELPAPRMVYAAATDFKSQGNFKPTEGEPRLIRLLHRGNILDPGDEVRPGTLPIVPGVLESLELAEDHAEADRRAALARWLTRPDHPLTWRSIVNRVWLYHFGRGIADSPNDFGSMGQQPSHPQLLDWLACEFRDGGQSFKKLHRLIVTSSVYRQMADHEPRQASIDSDNQYLWRMNRRRLTAEEIRDAVLAVSGKLDKEMYGPGFYLFELEKTEHSPHYEYHKHDPEDPASHRRSIYRFIVRSQPDPFMTTLDCADSSQSTPRRNETLTSLQALSLLNNKFTLAMAVHFASRLEKEAESLPTQLAWGIRLTTSRAPDPSQQSALVDYADRHGLPNACRVLFNLSEFVFVD